MPTGIMTFDSVMNGGIPSGSFLLLLGDVGSGHNEFAFTSAASLAHFKAYGTFLHYDTHVDEIPALRVDEIETTDLEEIILPEKITYLSFVRSKEDVINEIAHTLGEDYYEHLETIEFQDFSDKYFKESPVPHSWISDEPVDSLELLKRAGVEKDLMESLVEYLGEHAKNSVIIIDSLNDLMRISSNNMQWLDLISFLKGLQKVSKKWNCTIYALLTDGIFERGKQLEIMDFSDGVMVFKWEELGASGRQRTMCIEKFRGVLARLEKENITKFEACVNQEGYSLSNYRQIV